MEYSYWQNKPAEENTPINIVHRNTEEVSSKNAELQHFIHEIQTNIYCIQHLLHPRFPSE